MVAAFYGNTECVRILAEKESRLQDGNGRTALMYAAGNGHLECVQILAPLEKGMLNTSGRSALYYTIYNSSNVDCARFLWQFPGERETKGSDRVKRKHRLERFSCSEGICLGVVSLLSAAFDGCLGCVQKHLDEAGRHDEKGMTALMIAAKYGYDDIVRILVEKEAKMHDE